MIVKTKGGYKVVSEHKGKDGKRKNLGSGYHSLKDAEKRLRAVEYFKHLKG